ncbi:MAG: DUF3110 domain-containing protein [Synechococcales bacterium]|nr:DUF3110 domain-containing protein [Cyanobacteria bacterium REEB444]MEB3124889.1 DUF3110 domain-containing protein [Synechococcales bacterium]
MRVFVLLFNPGTENEGIHTLTVGDRNIVLMFESEDDATRYALLLEAQDFLQPTIEAISQLDIEEFCSSAGYHCQYIPSGFIPQNDLERLLLVPPETSLDMTDWQSSSSVESETPSYLPDPELENFRRRLEGLL